jgi:hypothetical protein
MPECQHVARIIRTTTTAPIKICVLRGRFARVQGFTKVYGRTPGSPIPSVKVCECLRHRAWIAVVQVGDLRNLPYCD